MNVGRGYHTTTVLADGNVLAMGGSWSGAIADKPAELFDYKQNRWYLKRLLVAGGSFLTSNDARGIKDNHMWLFTAPNGLVFHAGPAKRMHWLDFDGDGKAQASLDRNYDSMNGGAVMYDIGKLITFGGALQHNSGVGAHNVAHLIDINQDTPKLKRIRMIHPRTYVSGVVLPSGQVIVMGGAVYANIFNDNSAVLEAELFDPETESFTELARMRIPRTYHSAAILMKDGRIMMGGGGLCGWCAVNHFDAEIFTPPYLLAGDGRPKTNRPTIRNVSSMDLVPGQTVSVDIDSTLDITDFAMIRLSAATHAVNADLRRVPLAFTKTGNGDTYELSLPNNQAILLPGSYWLFALDQDGTPSVGESVTVLVAPPESPRPPSSFRDCVPSRTTLVCNGSLAAGKAALQSSLYEGGRAFLAVDGNNDRSWSAGSVTHTLREVNPWWEVDLGETAKIDAIQIYNRADGLESRLNNYHVFVSRDAFGSRSYNDIANDPTVQKTFISGASGSLEQIFDAGIGRYIRIQLSGEGILSLAEVEVYGVAGVSLTTAPTENPTEPPTQTPTENPTEPPTQTPTENPTEPPTQTPTENPTKFPTELPTPMPTPECSISPENLVCNPSFESNTVSDGEKKEFSAMEVPGWQSLRGTVCLANSVEGMKAFDGSNAAELDCINGGAIEGLYQDIATEPGTTYRLSFMMRARDGSRASTEDEGINVSSFDTSSCGFHVLRLCSTPKTFSGV